MNKARNVITCPASQFRERIDGLMLGRRDWHGLAGWAVLVFAGMEIIGSLLCCQTPVRALNERLAHGELGGSGGYLFFMHVAFVTIGLALYLRSQSAVLGSYALPRVLRTGAHEDENGSFRTMLLLPLGLGGLLLGCLYLGAAPASAVNPFSVLSAAILGAAVFLIGIVLTFHLRQDGWVIIGCALGAFAYLGFQVGIGTDDGPRATAGLYTFSGSRARLAHLDLMLAVGLVAGIIGPWFRQVAVYIQLTPTPEGSAAVRHNLTEFAHKLLPPVRVRFDETFEKVMLLEDDGPAGYVVRDPHQWFPPCHRPYVAVDLEAFDRGLGLNARGMAGLVAECTALSPDGLLEATVQFTADASATPGALSFGVRLERDVTDLWLESIFGHRPQITLQRAATLAVEDLTARQPVPDPESVRIKVRGVFALAGKWVGQQLSHGGTTLPARPEREYLSKLSEAAEAAIPALLDIADHWAGARRLTRNENGSIRKSVVAYLCTRNAQGACLNTYTYLQKAVNLAVSTTVRFTSAADKVDAYLIHSLSHLERMLAEATRHSELERMTLMKRLHYRTTVLLKEWPQGITMLSRSMADDPTARLEEDATWHDPVLGLRNPGRMAESTRGARPGAATESNDQPLGEYDT